MNYIIKAGVMIQIFERVITKAVGVHWTECRVKT